MRGVAVLCLCHDVSDRVVRQAIAHGACTVDEIVERCDVGRDCGCCLVTVHEMLAASGPIERDPAQIVA